MDARWHTRSFKQWMGVPSVWLGYTPTRRTGDHPETCGLRRSGGFCGRSVSLVPDDEDACGGFDDVVGDGLKPVDLKDSGDRGVRNIGTKSHVSDWLGIAPVGSKLTLGDDPGRVQVTTVR